jgi:hypothetical protein
MNMRQWLIASLSLCLWASSALAIDPLPFRDAAEEDRFRALTAELRLCDVPEPVVGRFECDDRGAICVKKCSS